MGRTAESEALKARIIDSQPADAAAGSPARSKPAQWMVDSMNEQLAKLAALNP